jgi:putative sigma-54 modulation protein
MNITITGRNVEVTPALRKYAEEKIGKFEKYLSKISEAVVVLSVQKQLHKAEVQIKANGNHIKAESRTEELYASIDEVTAKLDRQIKKLKDKVTGKRSREKSARTTSEEGWAREKRQVAASESSEEAAPDERMIIESEPQELKPMSPEEAAMRLDTDGRDFFMFTNAESGKVNVIYKRNDGNFGLIEPVSR